jgi:myo-inositol-1(or 4)-monophosphatase
MKDLDLPQALSTALKAAKAGRQVLLDYFGRLKKVQEKAHAGLVSEADVESERVISQILKADFPAISFLGEEGAFLTQDSKVPDSSWIVDPLDGTTNYVHGFHIFNISIGLQVKGELVLGVVDVPMLNQTYTATKGGGAFLNGNRISVSDRKTIKDALLATGFFPDNVTALREQLKIFSDIVFDARGVRRPGAAAYDLALVAEGVFDAFWEPNLKPWDAAAGVVLVREAGGVVWTYDGADYKMGDTTLLSGNRDLARALVERIKPLRGSH